MVASSKSLKSIPANRTPESAKTGQSGQERLHNTLLQPKEGLSDFSCFELLWAVGCPGTPEACDFGLLVSIVGCFEVERIYSFGQPGFSGWGGGNCKGKASGLQD